jgi:hypothetical protein
MGSTRKGFKMTHDKKLLDVKYSFSPVSLEDAEKSTHLEKNLEMVITQESNLYSPAALEENHEWIQSDKTVSSALRNSTTYLWIFGLRCSSPCV